MADPETEFPDHWLDNLPAATESVTTDEARRFTHEVFQMVERKIFDPSFAKAERDAAEARVLEAVASGTVERGVLAGKLDEALKGIGISHLRLLNPEAMGKLGKMLKATVDTRPSVELENIGDIAVVHVRTFLVPAIRLEQVQSVMERVRKARAVLIDVRGNGGGSFSSVVYVAQYLLGADRPISFVRYRTGAEHATPFIQRGYLSDDSNEGSNADINLANLHGFVEWRTGGAVPTPLGRPAFLLTDGKCGSACDMFAAAIQENHAARLLGARTAGALLSGVLFRPSWRGYGLLVPGGTVLSPNGNTIEGVGVHPDVELPSCKEPTRKASDPDQCLKDALESVRAAEGAAVTIRPRAASWRAR